MSQLWGGRFAQGPDEAMARLSRSVHFDFRLAPYDIAGSHAHARILEAAGVISSDEAKRIHSALDQLHAEIRSEAFMPMESDEDVHSALERGLIEKLGELGGKLRAGRSRNDQVATDFRLYLLDHAKVLANEVWQLRSALINQAETMAGVISPGMTHLQHAQPVLFSHELLKHAHALGRDLDRLGDWHQRTNVSPLGAGALAGSSLPLNPEAAARDLGFAGSFGNSIDAVSDRDFVAEFLFVASMLAVHLSRIGEEWCLFTSREFQWATLDDRFSTGSSIMPQKKNPDIAELARGKSGRVIGHLTGILVVLKGLPFAYNRDLQEDKEPVFDTVETLLTLLPAVTGMVATTTFHSERISHGAGHGFALATDIAEWLVRNGVAFREAHEIAGACVRHCEERGIELWDLGDEDLKSVDVRLTAEVRSVLSVTGSVAARSATGGTAPERVNEQIASLKSVTLPTWAR